MADLEWDEAKRCGNFFKHDADFIDAYEILVDPDRLTLPDDRRDYGEPRLVIYGKNARGRVYVLVVTPRRDVLRVISLRPANARERKIYEQDKNDKSHPA